MKDPIFHILPSQAISVSSIFLNYCTAVRTFEFVENYESSISFCIWGFKFGMSLSQIVKIGSLWIQHPGIIRERKILEMGRPVKRVTVQMIGNGLVAGREMTEKVDS